MVFPFKRRSGIRFEDELLSLDSSLLLLADVSVPLLSRLAVSDDELLKSSTNLFPTFSFSSVAT